MKTEFLDCFDEAISDISDGASIMMFCWGVSGTPQNLIQTLYNRGKKDLTIISHNFIPAFAGSKVLWDVVTPYILVDRVKKLITAWPGTSLIGLKSKMEERIKTRQNKVGAHESWDISPKDSSRRKRDRRVLFAGRHRNNCGRWKGKKDYRRP